MYYVIYEPENDMSWPGAIRARSARAALDVALGHIREYPWVYQIKGATGAFELALRAVNVEDETDFSDGTVQLPGSGGDGIDDTVESLTSCIAATLRIAAGEPAAEVIHGLNLSDAGWVCEAVSRQLGRTILGERRTVVQNAAQALIEEVRAMGMPEQENGT